MKLTYRIFPGLLVILLFLVSCRKEVPKGQLIQANGFVIDSVKNKRLSNVKVYLYGGQKILFGVSYSFGPLDSAVSDKNGNFAIKYRADGNYVDYALSISNMVYGAFSGQANYVTDFSHPIYLFNYLHQLNNVAIKARELNYAIVNLKVFANPYDTLYLDMSSTHGEFFLRHQFIGQSIDTAFLTRYLPDATNVLEYKILSARVADSATMFLRRMPDTLPPATKDTILISKIINSTYDIPLKNY